MAGTAQDRPRPARGRPHLQRGSRRDARGGRDVEEAHERHPHRSWVRWRHRAEACSQGGLRRGRPDRQVCERPIRGVALRLPPGIPREARARALVEASQRRAFRLGPWTDPSSGTRRRVWAERPYDHAYAHAHGGPGGQEIVNDGKSGLVSERKTQGNPCCLVWYIIQVPDGFRVGCESRPSTWTTRRRLPVRARLRPLTWGFQ